ncbi:hypothetical protein M0802_013777 [Mischocyttarus mexicanus]|nr:hypothetical protein M0802_013777 [Mischocyttarus mexicanus]
MVLDVVRRERKEREKGEEEKEEEEKEEEEKEEKDDGRKTPLLYAMAWYAMVCYAVPACLPAAAACPGNVKVRFSRAMCSKDKEKILTFWRKFWRRFRRSKKYVTHSE